MPGELRQILKGQDLEAFNQNLAPRFDTPKNPKTEGDYRNVTREQAKKSTPLPRIPFVILTVVGRARAMKPMFSDAAIEEMVKLDTALMEKLAASIPGGRQIMVEGTGHYVHVDKPEALIAPVLEIIKSAKEQKRK
jgi:pimeloyl-ACP methyl ester carboxylesterase